MLGIVFVLYLLSHGCNNSVNPSTDSTVSSSTLKVPDQCTGIPSEG